MRCVIFKSVFLNLVITTTILLVSNNLFSQRNMFLLNAGPNFPLSDFRDDEFNSGSAATGFIAGGRYVYQVNNKGFGLFMGADFCHNGLLKSEQDEMKHLLQLRNLGRDLTVNYFSYLNVPVNMGLFLTYTPIEQFSWFAEIGCGPDYFKLTKMVVTIDNEKLTYYFKHSIEMGYKLGGGMLIHKKFNVGMYYYGMGTHKVEGHTEYDGRSNDLAPFVQEVSLLTFNFGLIF
ncbi:MAG: hypothetical protein U0T82_13820 [Bacteroidales bacterium]